MGLNHSSLYLMRVNYQTKLLRGNDKELCHRSSGNLHSFSAHRNSISISPNTWNPRKNLIMILAFTPCFKGVLSTTMCLAVEDYSFNNDTYSFCFARNRGDQKTNE